MNYTIITDEEKLDEFISFLPDNTDQEVFYICLFGRHKYCKDFPNTRGHLARIVAKKSEIKNKIRRLECPVGSYTRNGVIAPQEALALYITLNPRSLAKANKELLVELAQRCADGNLNFNPISLATTAVHRAVARKFFADFDFDDVTPETYLPQIKAILAPGWYKMLKTRGGFRLLVELEKVKGQTWFPSITALPKCDVRGSNTLVRRSNTLTPVAGCTQGGFTPYLINCTK